MSHKKLDVYQISLTLVSEVYQLARLLPKEELYVLASQIKRAALSVSCNIAEGASRISKREKRRFYEISRSSLVELDTQFEIAVNLAYFRQEQLLHMETSLTSVFRMLSKMIGNLDIVKDPN